MVVYERVVKEYVFTVDEQEEIKKEMHKPLLARREWGSFLKLVNNELKKHKPRMGTRWYISFEYPPDPDVVGCLHLHYVHAGFSVRDLVVHVFFARRLPEPKRWIEILILPDGSFHAWLYPKSSEIFEVVAMVDRETPRKTILDTMRRFDFDKWGDAINYLASLKLKPRIVKTAGTLGYKTYVFKL